VGELWDREMTSLSMRRSSVRVLGGVGVRSLRSLASIAVEDDDDDEDELYDLKSILLVL